MKRRLRLTVLAFCVAVTAVMHGMAACQETVYADGASAEIKAASISLDHAKSSIITTDGKLYMWGSYCYGSEDTGNRHIPLKIMDGVKLAALGDGFYGVVKTDGSLYMWGMNDSGQLGDGTTTGRQMPVKVLDNAVSVDMGYNYEHTGAVTADGSFYMWGRAHSGLGNVDDRSTVPVKIMDNAMSVSLGNEHSGVLTADGELYLWGGNSYWQMGANAERAGAVRPQKIRVNVASFSLGDFHSAAITKDGSLYVWGANTHGQIGNGTVSDHVEEPVKVMDNVVQVSLSGDGSAAITKDGKLYVWGSNSYGQVGNGSKIDCPTPVKILDDAASVSLSSTHSGAVMKDGSVYMWGNNTYGQLGDNSLEESLVPKKIALTNASIELGDDRQEQTTKKELVNTLYHDKTGLYLVGREANGQCIYYAALQKEITKAVIPATVTLDGRKYKVTSIYSGAFEDCIKLKSVKIGKNVEQIGDRAFAGCGNLKTVTIQSKNVKSAGKECFLGIYKKAVIKVPKEKLSAYKKIFKGKGQKSSVSITGF